MAYNAQGKWEVENANVAPRVTELLKNENPLIQQARSQGLATSNRRGMLNSSMAAGESQKAAYSVALPIASQEAAQVQQSNLAEQDRYAQMERLNADAGYTAQRQQNDIAAQLQQLREKAGYDKEMQATSLASTEKLTMAQINSEMDRLKFSSNADDKRQLAALAAQKEQQAADLASRAELQKNEISAQERSQASANAQQLKITSMTIGADAARQAADIDAQMARLTASASADDRRQAAALAEQRQQLTMQIDAQVQRDSAAATNAESLARLNGTISAGLQMVADQGKMQQLAASFAQETAMADKAAANDLAKIQATGDQQILQIVQDGYQKRLQLQDQIAAGDRQQIAQSMLQVFQSEAQMRQALLSNPEMPAAERAAYERSISSLGDPLRSYINGLYSANTAQAVPAAPAAVAAPTTQGLAAGLGPSLWWNP